MATWVRNYCQMTDYHTIFYRDKMVTSGTRAAPEITRDESVVSLARTTPSLDDGADFFQMYLYMSRIRQWCTRNPRLYNNNNNYCVINRTRAIILCDYRRDVVV